jgi:hypothetical protein
VSAEECEEKFYPSHWKRRVVFVIVKKGGQPRLGFVHSEKIRRREPSWARCDGLTSVTSCHATAGAVFLNSHFAVIHT